MVLESRNMAIRVASYLELILQALEIADFKLGQGL